MTKASPRASSTEAHLLAWRELTPEQIAAWSGFVWAHVQIIRELDLELKREHGVPLASFDVLFQLSLAGNDGLLMSELADAIVLTRTGLTELVERLHGGGLVEWGRSDFDPRQVYVRITARGSEVLARVAHTHVDGIKKQFLDRLSPAQTEQLAVIWETLLGRAPKLSFRRS
jgi:DNA-binding MarR family transcriptional regulator